MVTYSHPEASSLVAHGHKLATVTESCPQASSLSQTTQGQRCKEYLLYTLHHLSEGAVANTGDWDITRARSATKETAQASMNKLPEAAEFGAKVLQAALQCLPHVASAGNQRHDN